MPTNRIQAYWNETALTDENGFRTVRGSKWSPKRSEDTSGPSLSVSGGPDGFYSVLARPKSSNRAVALQLDHSPGPGTYIFAPKEADCFTVKLEFQDEPFPDPQMQSLALTSELCRITIGDKLILNLRQNATPSPEVKKVSGSVIEIADSCGVVPDFTQGALNYSDYPIISILVDLSQQDTTTSTDAEPSPILAHRIASYGGSQGTLNVLGGSDDSEFQWDGPTDTPALSVESVTVEPSDGAAWTVSNPALPAPEFTPLEDLTIDQRISELNSAFDRKSEISISEDVLESLATAVDGPVPAIQLTVRYESPKSDQIQSKSGPLTAVQSMYYAEPNRARHQIRFKDDTLHYVLIDPAESAIEPVSLYSKSYARHWDTDLGPITSLDISPIE